MRKVSSIKRTYMLFRGFLLKAIHLVDLFHYLKGISKVITCVTACSCPSTVTAMVTLSCGVVTGHVVSTMSNAFSSTLYTVIPCCTGCEITIG
jgi:hypothetical protein